MTGQAVCSVADDLAGVVGAEHVVTSDERLEYFPRDMSFELYERAGALTRRGLWD